MMFDAGKTWIIGLPYGEKNYDGMLSRFHLIPESFGRTDGQITVWTVVQTVLTATFNSYGNIQISTPYKISTPEPIEKKIGTVDYVREGTPYTKFGTNPPTEGF